MSDYDPSLVFLTTFCPAKNVSYLKVLKVETQQKERGYSIYEDEEKKDFVENIKTNLTDNGVGAKAPMFNDNF